jgi:hypothetical protein
MSEESKKHRVIGIRHTLKKIKDASLISDGIMYPDDAVDELNKIKKKSDSAKRYRAARSDATVGSIVKTIEETFNLPLGSVKLQYPSGKEANSDKTIKSLRKRWGKN